jgi:hypothetical protein
MKTDITIKLFHPIYISGGARRHLKAVRNA